MQMEIIDLGERQVAVGLIWHPLSAGEKPFPAARAMAEEMAPEDDADGKLDVACFYLHRHGAQTAQYGLGHYGEESVPKGVQGLAAVFAAHHPEGTVIGRFRLEDGRVWLVHVVDGAIDVAGDVVAEDDERADEVLHQWEEHMQTKPRFVGPTNDTWEEALAYFLEITVPPARSFALVGTTVPLLVPLYASALPKWLLPAAIGVAVVIILVAGLVWWQKYQHQQDQEIERQQMMEQAQEKMRREREAAAAAAAAAAKAKDRTLRAGAAWFLDTCATRFRERPVSIKGWNLALWRCHHAAGADELVIDVEWARAGGDYDARPPETLFNTSNPNRSVRQVRVPIPDETLFRPTADENARDVAELVYQVGLDVPFQTNIGWDRSRDPVLPPGAEMVEPAAKASNVRGEFTFTTQNHGPIPPMWIAERIGSSEGLYFTRIEWSRERDGWTLVGGILAEPAPEATTVATN